jgi:hypothetical protein
VSDGIFSTNRVAFTVRFFVARESDASIGTITFEPGTWIKGGLAIAIIFPETEFTVERNFIQASM